MKFISHRGNLYGPNPEHENRIAYIHTALDMGVDVEVDVWGVDARLYLGHDGPQERLPDEFLHDDRLWFHCKNMEALTYLSKFPSIKYFWHETDDYTLVSNKKVWVYPGAPLIENSIAVIPEILVEGDLRICYAICTDYVVRYQEELMYANQESKHIIES